MFAAAPKNLGFARFRKIIGFALGAPKTNGNKLRIPVRPETFIL